MIQTIFAILFGLAAIYQFVGGILAIKSGKASMGSTVTALVEKPVSFWFVIVIKIAILPPMLAAAGILTAALSEMGK